MTTIQTPPPPCSDDPRACFFINVLYTFRPGFHLYSCRRPQLPVHALGTLRSNANGGATKNSKQQNRPGKPASHFIHSQKISPDPPPQCLGSRFSFKFQFRLLFTLCLPNGQWSLVDVLDEEGRGGSKNWEGYVCPVGCKKPQEGWIVSKVAFRDFACVCVFVCVFCVRACVCVFVCVFCVRA